MMNCKEFIQIAWPQNRAHEQLEADVMSIMRAHRWVGLRLGYLFYALKLSANAVSLVRMLLSLTAFYLLSLAIRGNTWSPLMGAFLLYGQNILDYSDGAVARVSGKVSLVGEALDEIVNTYSRGCILVLAAAFTQHVFLIIISAFSSFILIHFRKYVGAKRFDGTPFEGIGLFYRIVFSMQVMLFVLPLLIALSNLLDNQLLRFSYILVGLYAALAIQWVLLCLWSKEAASPKA